MGCEARALDVTDAGACDALFSEAARFDVVDVVNLACFSEPAPLASGDVARARASWKRTLDVGLLGAMHVLSAAGLQLPKSGSVVSVSSINARLPVPAYGAYCAAKAGLEILTQVAASELAPMRVNAVAPRANRDFERRPRDFPAFLDGLRARHLAGKRLTRVSDVSRAVRFLLSEEASFVTGQTLTVDGGVSVNHGELPSPKDLARSLGDDE